MGKGKGMSKTYCAPSPLHEAKSVVFGFLTRILLSLQVMKLDPSHLNGRPYALMRPRYAHHPPALLSAPVATARAAGTHFKTGLAKRRPRPVRHSFRRGSLACGFGELDIGFHTFSAPFG